MKRSSKAAVYGTDLGPRPRLRRASTGDGYASPIGSGALSPSTGRLPDLYADAGRRTTIDICNADRALRSLKDIEDEAITLALTEFGGSISDAARCLGIGRSTLYRKMAGLRGS